MGENSFGWWQDVDGSIASLVPAFGNYCGPNWSEGKRWDNGQIPTFEMPPALLPGADGIVRPSPVDAACKGHDRLYTSAMGQPDEYQRQLLADIQLLDDISKMDWGNLSTAETEVAPGIRTAC